MRQPRRHRLPQRLDYALIPPPLDLSLPIVDEKSALPAIIVTPSSPSGDRDFSIAFLAPPVKDTAFTRIVTHLGSSRKDLFGGLLRARTLIFLLILFLILACHLVTHRMAMHRPRLHFDVHTQAHLSGFEGKTAQGAGNGANGWVDLNDYWNAKRTFVVVEPPAPAAAE